MCFSQTDFQNDEIRQKLMVIINDSIEVKPLQPFTTLTQKQMRVFNSKLQEYISKLPEDGYLEQIHKDFCIVMQDVFETLKPEEVFIRNMNTTIIELSKEDNLDERLAQLESEQLAN